MKDKALSVYLLCVVSASILCGYVLKDWFDWVVAQQIVLCAVMALVMPLSFNYKYLFVTSVCAFTMACIFLIHFSVGIAQYVSFVYSIGGISSIVIGILVQKFITNKRTT